MAQTYLHSLEGVHDASTSSIMHAHLNHLAFVLTCVEASVCRPIGYNAWLLFRRAFCVLFHRGEMRRLNSGLAEVPGNLDTDSIVRPHHVRSDRKQSCFILWRAAPIKPGAILHA